ncbi:MAG TPA: PAS domain S-box protein, partial [Candidatus Polarisedimenticolia bacterium]|nr:PAS domain S-box protein [Candidatus Polarisedimenticolia bacterium]
LEIATIRCAKDGSAVPVYLSVAAVRDASGGLVGTMEVARSSDAASPDTSHSYLAAIVTSSDDAIISKDLNGVIQSFNAAAERMFGYTSAEAVGQSITMLIPKERLAEEVEILSRLRRGERIEHFETVRKTKDGRVLDISLTVSPVRNAFGRVVGASKIARDITEMKRTAKALAMQQEWFRVTLNSIGDAVIATDESARVIFLNGTAERMTGWDSEEAVGKPLADVFHIQNEKTGMRAANPAEQVLATHRVVGLENHTVLVGRDGTRRPIDDSAAPILDSSGEVLGVVLVFRDVTERRRLESERQTAVQERERLLESERAARADAERANRVKDDFLAMVSHELRTPLNAILGWTDLLRHSQPDEATLRHGLEVVARNTRIQSQLISDLLDISRIVTGKLRLEVQRVDPVGAVEASVESVLHAAEQKGVEIRTEIEPSVGAVMGDPARLQQIVWNLLTNAIKFTPQGGHVLVRLASVGSGVEITVRDTGMGIRRELFQDLFERFRHTGATTRNYGGLGLGLSIVKHLVELHGGNVRASSPGEGQGATFTIELPLAGDGRSLRPLPTEKQDGEALSHRISLAGVAVLVVEDEADTRDLIRRVLESHEADVFLAATAAEAMEVLTAARPHILISDIGLPETDGYELMRRVRMSGTPQASLPAIALTAFARSEDRMRALRAGYQTHVAKPVEPAELVATVASLMEMIVPDRPS